VKFNTQIKLNTHIEYTLKWIHKIEPLKKQIRNKEPGWKKKPYTPILRSPSIKAHLLSREY